METGAKSFGREKFGAEKEPKANADVISGAEYVTINCLQCPIRGYMKLYAAQFWNYD